MEPDALVPAQVLLSLGSNVGKRRDALRGALRCVAVLPGTVVVASSHCYETDPVGVPDQAVFLNAAVAIETTLQPHALLAAAQEIERQVGRIPGRRWGPRRIDIDIVLWGDLMLEDAALTLPHPLFRERAFVLLPLSEIAPEAIDPVTGKNVAELAAALGAHGRVLKCEALTP